MKRRHNIALIPGDGIGPEVIASAVSALNKLSNNELSFAFEEYDWSTQRFLRTGAMMPANGLDSISADDAILLGAVGWPSVPDHVSLWGLLIPIRREFQQYVNLRPVKSLRFSSRVGESSNAKILDLIIVRENLEGEYSQIGGRLSPGQPEEAAIQTAIFTRKGVTRIVNYAFNLAVNRSHYVTSATKSNGIVHSMPFWDQIFEECASRFPNINTDKQHIDALAANLVLHPGRFDVIVASNLFGDILSDLAAALAGSIGVAPSANLNPEREYPSMFEPVHGSAPDIAGKGIANPLGALYSTVMLLEHLGEEAAAGRLRNAIDMTLAEPGMATPDLGGTASTSAFTDTVVSFL